MILCHKIKFYNYAENIGNTKQICFWTIGELTAYCMGPHQVAFCELQDNKDGTFNLGVKPQESGKHVLQIKYGGEHVQGTFIIVFQLISFIEGRSSALFTH